MDRLANSNVVDAARIARAIEFTRFPPLELDEGDKEDGLLLRAADLIGQLGDPHHLRKANALYQEFEGSLATPHPPISRIHTRSFFGAAFRRISRPPFST